MRGGGRIGYEFFLGPYAQWFSPEPTGEESGALAAHPVAGRRRDVPHPTQHGGVPAVHPGAGSAGGSP